MYIDYIDCYIIAGLHVLCDPPHPVADHTFCAFFTTFASLHILCSPPHVLCLHKLGYSPSPPLWGGGTASAVGEVTSSDLAPLGHLPQRGRQGRKPLPTSLRSATFPKGEGREGDPTLCKRKTSSVSPLGCHLPQRGRHRRRPLPSHLAVCHLPQRGRHRPSPLGRGDRVSGGRGNLFRPRYRSATFPKGEGREGSLFRPRSARPPSPKGKAGKETPLYASAKPLPSALWAATFPKGEGTEGDLFRQPFGLPPSPKGKAKALPFGEGGPRQRWER